MGAKSDAILAELRAWGLALPGAHSKAPWPEHDDLAVKDKTFAYLPKAGQPFSLSVKLPYTGAAVLDLPYATPTGYGLGKSGWVSLAPAEDAIPPLDQLKEWVEESYRAQAPRKLVRELDDRAR
ncbi:MmcQ/YjbR family DNA-binding protein [Sphingosinicella sp. YJ22]|uniref:MmcQ/YjbR family DNA-binding protein n=1 Tax=Sphingosinicella sp. YJ22 TaxID=1104780 RepID=UPI001408C906|nr:MmcQ/YjbR family DNA-binding protein [Sphingosinicella sp. YJ22]